jgi:hypothetical protein
MVRRIIRQSPQIDIYKDPLRVFCRAANKRALRSLHIGTQGPQDVKAGPMSILISMHMTEGAHSRAISIA